MGIVALIQAILSLPGAINSLIDKINSLEASLAKQAQQNESAAISKVQTDTQNAQSTDDYKKAADEAANALRNL